MKKTNKKSQHRPLKKKSPEVKAFDVSKNRREIIFFVIIVFCLPVLLYLQTLKFGYTHFDDDHLISNNISFLKDFHNAPKAFLTDAFTDRDSHFYRPLQTISYMTDIHLSGENSTWMYHLTNILLLGLIACVLFLLLRKFLIPIRLALLSTLVYCAHPLFISSIAWLPARGDLQLMFFSLLSFLFFTEFLQKKKIIYFFLHWATFTIALFCKETAIFLPLLFIIYYFTFSSEKRFEKKYFLHLSLYAVSGIYWFWLRSMAIGDLFNRNEILGVTGNDDLIGLTAVLSNLRTIPESLVNFFIPFDIAPIPGFSVFKTIIGIGIIALIGILFYKNKETSGKEKLFCLLWFLLLLIPTMLFKNNLIDYLHHRFFLPLIGILLFMLFLFPKKWFEKGDIKRSWIIVAVFLVLASFTFVKSRAYSNPIAFYKSTIFHNSNSALAYYNLGIEYNAQGAYDKVIDYYTKAIELKPDYATAYNNRGYVYNLQGYFDKAIADYNTAIESNPDYALAYNNRGVTYNNQGLYNKALNDFTKAIELFPDDASAYNNRGATYGRQGIYDKAIIDYTKAIELKPDYAAAYHNRGMTYAHQGLNEKAIADYNKAIEIKPDFTQAYNNRGMAYGNEGLYDKAINDFTKAIELKPDYAEAYNNHGMVNNRQGLSDKACQDFNKAEEFGSEDAKKNITEFCTRTKIR